MTDTTFPGTDDLGVTLTRAGLSASRNAQGTGQLYTIDRIAVGTGIPSGQSFMGYTPTGRETALRAEVARVPLLQGVSLGGIDGSDPIGFRVLAVLPALAAGAAPYPITEVGFFLADGTMLGLWSDPADVLTFRTAKSSTDLAFELYLQQLPTANLRITVLRPDVPDMAGVMAELLRGHARRTIAANAEFDRRTLLSL